jgi:hypothetical protein
LAGCISRLIQVEQRAPKAMDDSPVPGYFRRRCWRGRRISWTGAYHVTYHNVSSVEKPCEKNSPRNLRIHELGRIRAKLSRVRPIIKKQFFWFRQCIGMRKLRLSLASVEAFGKELEAARLCRVNDTATSRLCRVPASLTPRQCASVRVSSCHFYRTRRGLKNFLRPKFEAPSYPSK